MFLSYSCDKITPADNQKLLFSDDTVLFDTVFTTIGSTTRELRIKNPNNRTVNIEHLYLAGGSASKFRLNIDGEPLSEKRNVEIEAGDSIFIFIDVIIDPLEKNAPVAVTDSIIFLVKDQIQKVHLLAWGQDIFLINNKLIGTETWQKGKPYLIIGNVTIDTLETLTIEEGTRIYFHRNGSMTVAGNLVVNGTINLPVLFAGDRLEEMYEDIPGQWKGISLLNISKGNTINHAIIRNTVFGIQIGESGISTEFPVLKIFSSVIMHSTVSGLSSLISNIEAANCVISHCGSYCIYLAAGGEYSFTHCTLFNHWEYGLRLTPALYVSEKPEKQGSGTSQMNLHFHNSVIYGDNISEMKIIPLGKNLTGNYYFDYCLLKLDTLNSIFWEKDEFPKTLINRDPHFIDFNSWDLRPDTLSPLLNNGNTVYSAEYPFDIRGVSRTTDYAPDIGAFERVPGEKRKDK
jgi:hypothetical protein